MDYTGKICSVCGKAFGVDDDIVVCPECATPHHRECWFENGKCINSGKHSENFVWSVTNAFTSKETVSESEEAEEKENFSADPSTRICHICGSENPAETFHCGNCGALFGEKEEKTEIVNCAYCGAENNANAQRCKHCGAPVLKIFRSDNPFIHSTGMDPDEIVAGVTANEASLYTQASARFYLKKFRKIDNGKFTFNWAAFIFAPYWFFYRKLYKAGIAALLVFISLAMLTTGFYNTAYKAMDEYYAAVSPIIEENKDYTKLSEEDAKTLEDEMHKFIKVAALPIAIPIVITLLEKIVCGLIADRLYYYKMKEDLNVISEAVSEKEVKQIMILKRGRASVLAFTAALLGEQFLLSIFTTIADYISR